MHINDAALRRLSSRSRTVKEMESYLAEKGYEEEEIRGVIADFCACGYLNDERYCREYFRYAFGRGKGKRKVFAELRQKGVGAEVIETAFEDFSFEEEAFCDEKSRAREEAERVLRLAEIGEDEAVPEKIKARVARKLQSKGYGCDTIYSILGELNR